MEYVEKMKALVATPKGNGQTGYWKNRGFFRVYVNGHCVGSEPTPEQAQELIDQLTATEAEATE